jgi:two-component system, NarL family, response regulator NreC
VADLAVSGRKGLPAVQQLRKRSPGTPVVLLTRTDSTIAIRLGLSSGVQGYVRNEDAGVELVQAVEAALQGQLYLSATSGFKLD